MSNLTVTITKIVIAYNDGDRMVQFYNNVFNADLSPIQVQDFTFYKGSFGMLELLFCPNEMLKIKAEKNNIQLIVQVNDLEEVLQKVIQFGGKQVQDISKSVNGAVVGISDPDGNTIEIVEII